MYVEVIAITGPSLAVAGGTDVIRGLCVAGAVELVAALVVHIEALARLVEPEAVLGVEVVHVAVVGLAEFDTNADTEIPSEAEAVLPAWTGIVEHPRVM